MSSGLVCSYVELVRSSREVQSSCRLRFHSETTDFHVAFASADKRTGAETIMQHGRMFLSAPYRIEEWVSEPEQGTILDLHKQVLNAALRAFCHLSMFSGATGESARDKGWQEGREGLWVNAVAKGDEGCCWRT